jgi:hypothetical protein
MPKIDEYNSLRNEILVASQINASITWSVVLASGAILAMGSSQIGANPYVFLAPLLLIVPAMLTVATNDSGIWRIGSYISVFHENEETELRWETRNWRVVGQQKPTHHANPYVRFISTSMFVGLAVTCFMLAWQAKLPRRVFFAALAIAVCAFGYATRKIVTVKAQFDDNLRQWRRIKAEEEANQASEVTARKLAEPQG